MTAVIGNEVINKIVIIKLFLYFNVYLDSGYAAKIHKITTNNACEVEIPIPIKNERKIAVSDNMDLKLSNVIFSGIFSA